MLQNRNETVNCAQIFNYLPTPYTFPIDNATLDTPPTSFFNIVNSSNPNNIFVTCEGEVSDFEYVMLNRSSRCEWGNTPLQNCRPVQRDIHLVCMYIRRHMTSYRQM